MKSGELLSHLYRGQLDYAATWRQRLDATTNWSVMLTAALLTWIFSSRSHPHYVLLVGLIAATFFLFIEARRYIHYDVWRYRVRMLEEHMFSDSLDEEDNGAEWRDRLAEDLRRPTAKISFLEALIRRLRRVHAAILAVLLIAWLFRIAIFADEGASTLDAMAIEHVPGGIVAAVVGMYAAVLLTLALLPLQRQAKGEIADDGDYDHKHD